METANTSGRLIRGDMLDVASSLAPKTFRLIYLDPPFFTGRKQIGTKEGLVFDDCWDGDLDTYLAWLRQRLNALFPLLCDNGSIVLHIDWRTSHHARLMLDDLFGRTGFMNEIIWHYTGGGRSKRRFSCKHDTLLWYSRDTNPVFNIDQIRVPYKESSGYAKGGIIAASGKKYVPNPMGTPIDDVWDIPIINPMSLERVGYPTQKPLVLLKRIISALSNEGDLIGDFCSGSGTTLVAAQQLQRNWLGSDISAAAISCAQERLFAECQLAITPEILSSNNFNK